MGILNAIQQKQKGRLSFFLCQLKHILHLGVFIGSRISDHSLMLSRLRKLIQTLLSHIVDNCVVFFRFPYDGAHRAVLAAIQNKQLVNGLSGTKGLQHCIASLDGQFFVSHEMFLLYISSKAPIFSSPRLINSARRSNLSSRNSQPTKASMPVAVR